VIGRETVIQWYPGHMAAAMRELERRVKVIDVFIQVIDARIVRSGANPDLAKIAGNKPRLTILTRDDLAEPATTKLWLDWYAQRGERAVAVNAHESGAFAQVNFFLNQLVGAVKKRGSVRAMVFGIPNAGKSRVINGLLRRSVAKVQDRPGVTRGPQWFRVGPNLELMDTPGVLAPKIESPESQWRLALCGAIPRERFSPEDVVRRFLAWAPTKRERRLPTLEGFASGRAMLRAGGELELHNAALAYIADFNDGKFGRWSFEAPEAAAG
jgi:ribosome biogenesis GTPase A